MPRTQISCPNCRQPIQAQVEQLFDVSADPAAKQRLIGGVSNRAMCPFCGYEGQLATPIVYHDADKELLLTFFPSELGLPVNEQEKMIGPMITQVVNNLPNEKRKGYLFRPQSHLTYQSLIERILAADGITPDMISAQQKRIDLIQRLMSITTEDVRKEVIQQEKALLDESFFALLGRLLEAAAASGQQQSAQALNALQQQLLEESEYGRKILGQYKEMEAAVKTLQEIGKELTREKLLEVFIAAPNEERLRALVSMTRSGLDYSFFQILSERIDREAGADKEKLESLRTRLLDMTSEIDKHLEAQYNEARKFIEELLSQPDIQNATQENLDAFNDFAVQVLNDMLRDASQKKDSQQLDRLQQIVSVLQSASTPPPEYALLEKLLEAEDDSTLEAMLNEHQDELSDEFTQLVGGLMAQMENQPASGNPDDEQVADRLQRIYRAVLKMSMKRSWQQ